MSNHSNRRSSRRNLEQQSSREEDCDVTPAPSQDAEEEGEEDRDTLQSSATTTASDDSLMDVPDHSRSVTPSESNKAAGELQKGLLLMYRRQALTDVSVRVGRAVFRCHRVVLCAMSDFFQRLLSDDPDRRLIIIQNVDSGVFEDVLEYIYTGRFVIRDNFNDFLKLITRLEMSCLASKIETFLERNMAPDNCIQIWRHAMRMPELNQLADKAAVYITQNFFHSDIKQQLWELTLPELIHILEDDDLPADDEEMVVRRGLQWLKRRKVRGADAGELFQRLRLPLTSQDFLRKEVDILQSIQQNDLCREVVTEAMTYMSNLERRHEFHSTRIAFRNRNPYREVLVVFGGYKFGGDRALDVLALNLKDRQWHSLAPMDHHPGKGMATAVYDNNIYVTGGTRDQQAFWRYISSKNRWEQGPYMINGRRDHCMEVLAGGVVCVIGGYGREEPEEGEAQEGEELEDEPVLEVEILGSGDEDWRGVINLLLPISQTASCASTDGTKIYLLGGRMSDGRPTDSLQYLDLTAQTCTLLSSSLPVACSAAVGLRTYWAYYLLTTNGELLRLQVDTAKVLSNDKLPHFKRKRFRLAVHHDQLLVIGGEDGQQVYRDMVCVGLKKTSVQLVLWDDFLPPVRSHFGLAKLIVPRDSLGEALW